MPTTDGNTGLDPTRVSRVTASMAPWLMAGRKDIIQNYFLRGIGDPRYVDDGFSDSWAARYGRLVEPLALDYHQEKTGCQLVDRQKQFFHSTRDYVSATLDARKLPDNIVVDVKASIDPTKSVDDIVAFYTPQLIVQEECAEARGSALLVVHRGNAPIECPRPRIPADYRAAIWHAIDEFNRCLETLTPPFALQFPRIVPPERWVSIDLDQSEPNWAEEMRELLADWDSTEDAARAHAQVKEDIKALLPEDCGKLTSGKLIILRSRNNAVTIKHRKEETHAA